jgi:hypothetical protein
MRKVTLQVNRPPSPVVVNSNPFLIENLIWLGLEFAITGTSEGLTLTLIPEKNDSGISLSISGINGLDEDSTTRLPSGCNDLLDASGAYLATDVAGKTLTIHLV